MHLGPGLEQVHPRQLLAELKLREAHLRSGFTAASAPPVSDLSLFGTQELFEAFLIRTQGIHDGHVVNGGNGDDRIDLKDVADPAILEAASGVALIVHHSFLDAVDGTHSRLVTTTLQEAYQVCEDEAFSQQPCVPAQTGFLVAPDLVATASHGVPTAQLGEKHFVFGFRLKDPIEETVLIESSEIYWAAAIIPHPAGQPRPEWALIRLDRPVPNHPFSQIRRAGKVRDGQSVHVIGHPCGLPLKFAGNARIRDNSDGPLFHADVDVFGGNSGSPIYNSTTGEVEGLLLGTTQDFTPPAHLVTVGGCRRSLHFSDEESIGERCLRTTEFAHLVPEFVV